MKQTLYSIHDRLAETYSPPMSMPEKIIMRQLEYILSDMSRLDCSDKECVALGSWDNETGLIEAHRPKVIADLSKLKAQMEGKANG